MNEHLSTSTPKAGPRDSSSGLLDLRALVEAAQHHDGATRRSHSELLAYGSATPVGGSPMLAPERPSVISAEKHRRRVRGLGALVAASLSVAAAAVVALGLTLGSADPVGAATGTTTPGGEIAAPTAPTATPEPEPTGEPVTVAEEPGLAAEPEAATDAPEPEPASAATTRRPRTRTPVATAPEPESETTYRPRTLEELMGGTPEPTEPAEEPVATTPAVPDTPSRSAVLSALRGRTDAVSACYEGTHGVATVRVTFEGATGQARGAVVSGDFAGTSTGSCVARAVRGAELPEFGRDTFVVTFPYRL